MEIAYLLDQIEQSGEFATGGTKALPIPGLVVDGVGEISPPVSEHQAQQLIKAASRATHGKGKKEVLDEGYRATWEIGTAYFDF